MKMIHHLKARWLLLAMLAAIAISEAIAWQIAQIFHVRFEWVAAAAIGVGVTAVITSLVYDGRE